MWRYFVKYLLIYFLISGSLSFEIESIKFKIVSSGGKPPCDFNFFEKFTVSNISLNFINIKLSRLPDTTPLSLNVGKHIL